MHRLCLAGRTEDVISSSKFDHFLLIYNVVDIGQSLERGRVYAQIEIP